MGRPQKDIPDSSQASGLARYLRDLKDDAQLTHRQMSDHPDSGGRSPSTWSRADSGKSVPGAETVAAYVRVCGGGDATQREAHRLWTVASRPGVPAGRWLTPREMSSVAQLGEVMCFLREELGNPSLRDLEALAASHGMPPMPRSTLGDALRGTHVPTADVFLAFVELAAASGSPSALLFGLGDWAEAASRVLSARRRAPRNTAAVASARTDRPAGTRRRPVRRSWAPPGAPAAFKEYIYDLHALAGAPSLQAVVDLIRQDDFLAAAPSRSVVKRCLESPYPPSDEMDARAIAFVLARAGGCPPAAAAAQAGLLWQRAIAAPPVPGALVREVVDPFVFGVRRPIDVESAPDLPMLPPYVARQHDEQLRQGISEAVRKGRSGMWVLWGEPSTGRARGCWEVLRTVPRSWRLWQPPPQDSVHALLEEAEKIHPQTVLWLRGIDVLMADSPGLSDLVYEKIQSLITHVDRAPVLVLATATAYRSDRGVMTLDSRLADPIKTLIGAHAITVPNRFSSAELDELSDRGVDDHRVVLAVQYSDNRVAQYLGRNPWAPRAPHTTAFETGMRAGDTDSLHIGGAALSRIGQPEHALVWHKLAAEQGDPVSLRIALEIMRDLGATGELLGWLEGLAAAGGVDSAVQLGRHLRLNGDAVGAARWYQIATDRGAGPAVMEIAARLLVQSGQADQALDWVTGLVVEGRKGARLLAADLLWNSGRHDRALTEYEQAAQEGTRSALRTAAERLHTAGQHEVAARYLMQAAASGDGGIVALAAKVTDHLSSSQALDWWKAISTAPGCTFEVKTAATRAASVLLLHAGDAKGALSWATIAAKRSDAAAMRILGVIHHRSFNDAATAQYWFEQAILHGDKPAAQWIQPQEGDEDLPEWETGGDAKWL